MPALAPSERPHPLFSHLDRLIGRTPIDLMREPPGATSSTLEIPRTRNESFIDGALVRTCTRF
jgi:hypothetical protein